MNAIYGHLENTMDEESTWFCPFRVFDVLIESDDIGHDVIRVSADYMWAYYIDRWSILFEKMENITQSFVVRERIAMDNIEITPPLYM